MSRIAVIGNCNIDVRTSPITVRDAILSDGETSVDAIAESVGGGGATTAVAAAVMGAEVHFCASIGDDARGRRLDSFMRALSIKTHLAVKPVETGISIALNWSNNHRHFVSSLPNCQYLEPADIELDALERAGCRHLYRSDIWFSAPMLFGGNALLLRAARERGMSTSLDVNWDPLWSATVQSEEIRRRIAAVEEIIPHVSYVHGNEGELMRFTRTESLKAAINALLDRGAGTVIVHSGPKGSSGHTPTATVEAPALVVPRPRSQAGSGDVFTAAFLLLDGIPLRERLTRSNEIAGRHLMGAPSYIPTLDADFPHAAINGS